MIVIDYSQTVISNLMAEIGNRTDIPIEVNLLRHMVINTIRSHKVKFGRDYGEVIIACDSKQQYWRKQYFPHYKANRKKAREDSGLDWSLIFDTIRTIKDELKLFFPYKVIEVSGAEADDVIATLAEWSSTNDLEQTGLIEAPKDFLIISGDHDFYQLQKYKHVKQYSPLHKKFVKGDTTPERYVMEHIFKGDKGDGIPNILTEDDAFITGSRQKPVTQKKMDEWFEDTSILLKDANLNRNYHRNKTLVDFSMIPQEVKSSIINTFTSAPNGDKSKLLDYFISNRMKQMIEHLEEF